MRDEAAPDPSLPCLALRGGAVWTPRGPGSATPGGQRSAETSFLTEATGCSGWK